MPEPKRYFGTALLLLLNYKKMGSTGSTQGKTLRHQSTAVTSLRNTKISRPEPAKPALTDFEELVPAYTYQNTEWLRGVYKPYQHQCMLKKTPMIASCSLPEDIALKLSHPNIAWGGTDFIDNSNRYVVYPEFTTMRTLISEFRPVPERTAAIVLKQLLLALAHCHALGVIHRDVKPENVYIGKDLRVMLGGFDYSCLKTMGQSPCVGAPYYMAPETVQGLWREKSDLWSCGIILFIALTGIRPYAGLDSHSIFLEAKDKPFELNPHRARLSPRAYSFLTTLLQHDPAARSSARVALTHPWLVQHTQVTLRRALTVVPRQGQLASALSALLVQFARDHGYVTEWSNCFNELTDSSLVSAATFNAYCKATLELEFDQIPLFAQAFGEASEITQEQFLRATLHLEPELVQAVFRHLQGRDRYLSAAGLHALLGLRAMAGETGALLDWKDFLQLFHS